jgi:hypothetical protein
MFSSAQAWWEKGTVSEVEECVEKHLSKSKSMYELRWFCRKKLAKKCKGDIQLYGETAKWYLCDKKGTIFFDWHHKTKGVVVTGYRGEMTLKVEGKTIGPLLCEHEQSYAEYGKDNVGSCEAPKRIQKKLCDVIGRDCIPKSNGTYDCLFGKLKKLEQFDDGSYVQWTIQATKCLIDDED